MNGLLLLNVMVVCCTTCIYAQQIAIVPDYTESAAPLAKNSLQIDEAFMFSKGKINTDVEHYLVLPDNLINYGLSNTVEIRLNNQLSVLNSKVGLNDLEVGIKWLLPLKRKQQKTSASLVTHMVIPVGYEAFTSGVFGVMNRLCISHQFKKSSLSYNLAQYYYTDKSNYLSYAANYSYTINEKWIAQLEFFGDIYKNKMTKYYYVATGGSYKYNNSLQLNNYLGTEIKRNYIFFSTGFTVNFDIKKKNNNG